MPNQPLKKKNRRAERPTKIGRFVPPTVSYQMVDGVSEEEIQRRVDRAFDILFREFFKEQIELSTIRMNIPIDNSAQLRVQ